MEHREERHQGRDRDGVLLPYWHPSVSSSAGTLKPRRREERLWLPGVMAPADLKRGDPS